MSKTGARRRPRPASAVPRADALHSLGVLAFESGDNASAAALFARAVAADPQSDSCRGMAAALLAAGNPSAAAVCCRQAIALGARGAVVFYLLGCALLQNGEPQAAVGALADALSLQPRFPDALCALGAAFHQLDAADDAEEAYRRALALRPHYAEAWHNRGLNAASRGNSEFAAACFAEALRIRPSYSDAHNNLGVLRHADAPAEAARHYREALAHAPFHLRALANLARAQYDCGDLEDAEASCRAVLERSPQNTEALTSLAGVLVGQGRWEEAAHAFDAALRASPHDGAALVNAGMLDLLRGRFRQGWERYRHRASRLPAGIPRWDGCPSTAKRVLLSAEQGFGDTLQFVRYAPMVRSRGACVLLESPPELERLLRTAPGVDSIVPAASPPPEIDACAPLLDLPRIFETDLSSIPAATPYLSADGAGMEEWRTRVRAHSGRLKVGLAWAGSSGHQNDRNRSLAPGALAAIAESADAIFFSLQKGRETGDLPPFFTPLDRPLGDFADTAALMMNLDLVISVDTAVAHLAGALARPVWTLLPFAPDWRWLLDRDDSPWYPSMRLFRQPRRGDWDAVLRSAGDSLARAIEIGSAARRF